MDNLSVLNLLKENKLKVTECRVKILEIIQNTETPLAVKEIYNEMVKKNIDVEYSTVYRCINVFVDKNILIKYDMKDGKYYYSIRNHHHTHIVKCKICNKATEIDCPLEEISEEIYLKTGFSIDCKDVELEAICKECKKNGEEEKKS